MRSFLLSTTAAMLLGLLALCGARAADDPKTEIKVGDKAPAFEAKDVQWMLDWVATQPGVRLDGPGDPRVGMAGGSYGGGIQLIN